MEKVSVLIVGADAELEARLVGALRDSIKLVGSEPPQLDRALDSYRRYVPQVVLVAMSFDRDAVGEIVRQVNDAGGRVVVVGPKKDSDLILLAMRSGAREFVVEGDAEDLRRAIREQAKPTESAGLGQVITVFPAKGGVGATAIATNLAGAVQRAGLRVLVLDLDLHLGDVLSFLDLPATYSITDVLSNMKRLDHDLLDTSLTTHPSGVKVLGQSGKVEEAEHVRGAEIASLIEFLRRHYDRIVIDGVRGFDEISLSALDASHHVLMVLTQDVPAVRNTQRCLDLFRRLGYEGDRVHLLLNRFQKGSKITPEVITDALGVAPAFQLANDFPAVIGAINRGNLLSDVAPRSKLTRDIEAMAPFLAGSERGVARPQGGFLSKLFAGKDAAKQASKETHGPTRTSDAG